MIGKIAPKGRGFRGLSEYLLRAGRGQIVAGPMAGITPRELAREFGALRRLNPKLTKAVAHLMVSPAPDDPKFTQAQWHDVAHRYVEGMGFGNAPWLAIVHDDAANQHMHVIACRIRLDGKTVSDANDFHRSEALVREIEKEFGLTTVASPPRVERSRSGVNKKINNQSTQLGDKAMTTSRPDQQITLNESASWPSDCGDYTQNPFDALGAIAPPGADPGTPLSEIELREMRRQLVERDYKGRMSLLFGDDLVRTHKQRRDMVLYFKQPGRIVDSGDRLTVLGGMEVKLAAQRIVALGVERGWKSIGFTGNASFVENAMREAVVARLEVVAKDKSQAAILAKVLAERQGRMGKVGEPAPLPAGAVAADSDIPNIPSSLTPGLVGVLPHLLTLPDRINERRAQSATRDVNPPRVQSPKGSQRPGL